MPETKTDKTAPKGIQISKIAKEINRQSSEILDYLKRIGVEVGGIMSKVDETTHGKILGHFKSDIEEAEKHKQKVIELHPDKDQDVKVPAMERVKRATAPDSNQAPVDRMDIAHPSFPKDKN